jgi:hypothetical protein
MDYHDQHGVNIPRQWFDSLPASAQALIIFAIREVEATTNLESCDEFVRCQRQHVGLWEIRVELLEHNNKRKFRPVGFWNSNPNELIVVHPAKTGQVNWV